MIQRYRFDRLKFLHSFLKVVIKLFALFCDTHDKILRIVF